MARDGARLLMLGTPNARLVGADAGAVGRRHLRQHAGRGRRAVPGPDGARADGAPPRLPPAAGRPARPEAWISASNATWATLAADDLEAPARAQLVAQPQGAARRSTRGACRRRPCSTAPSRCASGSTPSATSDPRDFATSWRWSSAAPSSRRTATRSARTGLVYLNAPDDGDGRVTLHERAAARRADLGARLRARQPAGLQGRLRRLPRAAARPATTQKLDAVVGGARRARRRGAIAHVRSRPAHDSASAACRRKTRRAVVAQPARPTRPAGAPRDTALRITVRNGDLSFVHQPLLLGHYQSLRLTGTEYVMDRLIGGQMERRARGGPLSGRDRRARDLPQHPCRGGRSAPVAAAAGGHRRRPGRGGQAARDRSGRRRCVRRRSVGRCAPPSSGDAPVAVRAGGDADRQRRQRHHASASRRSSSPRACARPTSACTTRISDVQPDATRVAAGRPSVPDRAVPRSRHRGLARPAGAGAGDAGRLCGQRHGRQSAPARCRGRSTPAIAAPTTTSSARSPSRTARATRRSRTRSTPSARAPRCAPRRRRDSLLRELVASGSTDENTDPQIGSTLFKLLCRSRSSRSSAAAPRCRSSSTTAPPAFRGSCSTPIPTGGDPRPWAIRAKLLRKLRTVEFRAQVHDASADDGILVIGEPEASPEAGRNVTYPRLPGARDEASAVAALLRRGPPERRGASGSVRCAA